MENLCGKLSHNKFVSEKIVFSNPECIRGFLDAYISGDGTVSKTKKEIIVTSVSYKLLLDVQIMCKNLGIVGKVMKMKKLERNNRGTKPENIHQPYSIRFSNQQMKKLANILNLTIEMKRERIQLIREKEFSIEYNNFDLTLPNCINGEIILEQRNKRMMDLEFDKVLKIEEVSNTTDYAYDLTVEDTRNFDIYNAVCLNDTFHSAGISSKSNVTRGVPRIEEILRLTKNPKNPSLTIHLNPMEETDKNKATQYSNMLEHTKLINVVKSVQICFDPNDKLTTIGEDKLLMQQYYEFENVLDECLGVTAEMSDAEAQAKSKWLIRMEIDAETLLEKNITMDDIHFAIKNAYGNDTSCIYSDYNDNKLVFRLRLNNEILNKKRKKGGPPDTLDQSDDIYLLRNFQDTLLNNVVLRGVTKIRSVTARKLQNCVIKEEGKYVRKDTWVLDTTGTNLMSVMALDYIDANRTYSNDIKEIFDVLGIEAARQVIFNEFSEVMEFSGGIYINYHHLSILCDRMTSNENMVSIFRSGILNDDIGPISKSTFEVHTEVLLNASRHADFDHMRGVSANIMMGQTGYFGTGSFQLVVDMVQMQDMEDKEVDTVDKQDEIDKLFGGIEDSADICSKKNVTIKNNLVAVRKSDIGEVDDDYDIGF
jgi:DNA-directed RNA polymerase beta' subunit